MTRFQAGPFEPLGVYDAPQTLFTQLLDGEATWESFRDTFLEPSRLTPRQRDSVVTRLKERIGRNPLTDSLVDVATNPFVWMLFLTSPSGASALGGGARSLFNATGKGYNVWVQRNHGWLGPLLGDAHALADGSPLGKAWMEFSRRYRRIQDRGRAMVLEPAMERFYGLHGVQNMDPAKQTDPAKAQLLRRVQLLITMSNNGRDRARAVGGKTIPVAGGLYVGPKDQPFSAARRMVPGETHSDEEVAKVWDLLKKQMVKEGATTPVPVKLGGEDMLAYGRSGMAEEGITMIRTAAPKGAKGEAVMIPVWGAHEKQAERLLRDIPGAWELRNAYNDASLMHFILTYGNRDARQAIRRHFRQTGQVLRYPAERTGAASHWGKRTPEGTLRWIDDNRLQKWLRKARGVTLGAQRGDTGFVDDLMQAEVLAGKPMRRAIRIAYVKEGPKELWKGVTLEQYRELVAEQLIRNTSFDEYFPRSVMKLHQWNGTKGVWEALPDTHTAVMKDRKGIAFGPESARGRLREEADWWPEDLKELQTILSEEGRFDPAIMGIQREIDRVGAVPRALEGQERRIFYHMNADEAYRRYMRTTAREAAWSATPSGHLVKLQKYLIDEVKKRDEAAGRVYEDRQVGFYPRSLHPEVSKRNLPRRKMTEAIDDIPPEEAPPGGWSLADVVDSSLEMIPPEGGGDKLREYFKHVSRVVSGEYHYPTAWAEMQVARQQHLMRAVADGPIGKTIESVPLGGRKFVESMRRISRMDTEELTRRGISNVTGYSYAVHLGWNIGSFLLNITQPWLLAATHLGGTNVAAAYKDAFADMFRYGRERIKRHGLSRITDAERLQLLRDTFSFSDETGLLGELFRDLDATMLDALPGTAPSLKRSWLLEYPLKLFEKGEWLNRAVVTHATRRLYAQQGRTGARILRNRYGAMTLGDDFESDLLRQDMTRAVAATQFGAGPLNTPAILSGGAGPAPGLFAQPFVRQFRTFQTRSFVGPFLLGPRIGGGRRTIGFHKVGGPSADVPWFVVDPLRMMGFSAIIYEVAKNLLGADWSRAGAVSTTLEWTGVTPGRFDREQIGTGVNPLHSPLVSIGLDAVSGVMGEDARFLRDSLARTIPGGIAVQKVLGSLPKDPGPSLLGNFAGRMQKTYADWGAVAPDGRVPIFKGSGELIEYRPASRVVLEALGADLGSHRHSADLDHWMTQNRDRIVQARAQFLHALVSNNTAKARDISRQFQREFQIPLTVNKAQLRAFIQRRNVPRTERILDRMPREVRAQFQQTVAAGDPSRLGLTREQILAGETARKREQGGAERFRHTQMSPEALEELRKALAAGTDERTFGSYVNEGY
jgi:hypothetical protein